MATANYEVADFAFCSITSTAGKYQLAEILKSIAYSDELTPGVTEAGQPQPIGWTRGKYSPSASIEFARRADYQLWIDSLGDGYMEKAFTLTHSYQEEGAKTLTDKLVGCRIKKADVSASGTDAVGVKVELAVLGGIVWNGKKPIRNMKGV